MTGTGKGLWRVALGAALGALLAPLVVRWLAYSFLMPLAGNGEPRLVTAAMEAAFGSLWLALVVQSALAALLGGVVAAATLPFADDGPTLVRRSVAHFVLTAAAFALLLRVCCWQENWGVVLLWVLLMAVLYLLIWLGRWVGWYVEVAQLRALLGLSRGPSPLRWLETAPYLPFTALICFAVPLGLRWVELLLGGGDVPALTGLLYPFLLLPVVGFCSGLSLGKRQGVCPLYPVAGFCCCLPLTWLLPGSLPQAYYLACSLPALAGNLVGALIWKRRAKKNADG